VGAGKVQEAQSEQDSRRSRTSLPTTVLYNSPSINQVFLCYHNSYCVASRSITRKQPICDEEITSNIVADAAKRCDKAVSVARASNGVANCDLARIRADRHPGEDGGSRTDLQ
jgi:hypothetical protein